jgi:dynein light chain 1
MDKDITTLAACEHLALSTNAIEKIGPGLKDLKNLKILSLGRNAIRKLEQLDLPQLEQLWVSYNKVDKLSGMDKLKSLKVLYMSNNQIASWSEIDRLANQCPELKDVLFINNPIQKNASSEKEYRLMMLQRLPKLQVLDGIPVELEEREEADKLRGA